MRMFHFLQSEAFTPLSVTHKASLEGNKTEQNACGLCVLRCLCIKESTYFSELGRGCGVTSIWRGLNDVSHPGVNGQ